MAFLTSGGSIVNTSQIVDGAVTNAKINAAAAIAVSKLAARVRATATKSANQSCAVGATKVTFDTEVTDTNSAFASSTFTAPVAGWYKVSCRLTILNTEGTPRPFNLMIYQNGAAIHNSPSLIGGETTVNSGTQIQETILLAANDTVEIYHTASTGISQTIVGGATHSRLNIEYVSVA